MFFSQFCAPGTVFNQKILTCDYPKDTDCAASKSYWPANEELGNFDFSFINLLLD